MSSTLWRLFNLRRDQDDPDAIDADIRAGAQPVGANLWVLFFAILIASVGLNVNSTAVIVGAMLISPLMGPILAIGYGAAVQDFKLIRQGFVALAIFTVVSLLTSALYFALSPLDQPGSELLARTTPTLWDVLIATFGGAAGMIAATRKDVNNVLPGVAIATALMPPLCTAGFGLAHGRWDMFFGASYLFLINGVFIAVSTLAISKVLRLPRRGVVDDAALRRHRVVIVVSIIAVMAPSVWLGARFVRQEVFNSGALRVVEQIRSDPEFNVIWQQVDPQARAVRLTLIGRFDEDRVKAVTKALLVQQGLGDANIEVRDAGTSRADMDSVRTQVQKDIDGALIQQLHASDVKLKELGAAVQRLQEKPAAPVMPDTLALRNEIQAQFPQVKAVALALGARVAEGGASAEDTAIVLLDVSAPLTADQQTSLQRWLVVRLAQPNVQLVAQKTASEAPASERPRR